MEQVSEDENEEKNEMMRQKVKKKAPHCVTLGRAVIDRGSVGWRNPSRGGVVGLPLEHAPRVERSLRVDGHKSLINERRKGNERREITKLMARAGGGGKAKGEGKGEMETRRER